MDFVKKLTGFDAQKNTMRTEVVAGLTTFLTMSYILAVNPAILGQAGMDKGAVFTATAITSAVATILMAIVAKLPFGLAPSMSINAFFTFTLVMGMGYSWQMALTCVFIEGILFLLITLFNVQKYLLMAIPGSQRHAISAGIGIFIAFIGLKNAGLVVTSPTTLVQLGKITPATILAFATIILAGVLLHRKVIGGLFISIIVFTLIGIPLHITEIPKGFSFVSIPHSMAPTFWKFDFSQLLDVNVIMVIVTLLFLNVFDTMSMIVGLSGKAGVTKENGDIPRFKGALMSNAFSVALGSILGTTSVSTFSESATGIAEGGRTGMTSLVAGIMFLIALFLAPIFMMIPIAATTGPLVIVGVLMMDEITKIDLEDMTEALPAFLTVVMISLTSSIADGMIIGLVSYVIVKMLSGKFKDLNVAMYILAGLFILKFIFS